MDCSIPFMGYVFNNFMVPTWTGKLGKCENIFQSGKSQVILNRLEKSGNFTPNTEKVKDFVQFLFLFFFDFFLFEVYLLNSSNKTLKKY